MNTCKLSAVIRLLMLVCLKSLATAQASYANDSIRKPSAGHQDYFVDPVNGNDKNKGNNRSNAWKTFALVNKLSLAAGDKLTIFPGRFDHSLMLAAKGTKAQPVSVFFYPGRYELYDTNAYRTKLHITNTNDVPDGLKAIAIGVIASKNVVINGYGAKLVLHAKMIETYIDKSDNIILNGLSYDYNTPTVSEFKVSELTDNYADLEVHKDSHYDIVDSMLFWKGDGWRYQNSWYWQEFDPTNAFVTRSGLHWDKAKFSETTDHRIRVKIAGNTGLKKGMIYQTRDVTRDCAGLFFNQSKNIVLRNIRIYYMHGMGVVSQYCDNVTMDGVNVSPDKTSRRTCAAWADILHFAGCKGKITVKNSKLTAANDDAINVHGIHLRILEQPEPNQLLVRFMHGQTYGFNAYAPGDSIELIHGNTLLAFEKNVVAASQMINDKDILLTLKRPVKNDLLKDDAVENITRTPSVHITGNSIFSIPTRGVLVTTRLKVMIERNQFIRTASQAVLVEDDAEGWFESGMVKDLTIRDNYFKNCGEAVISINPENKVHGGAVHRNIKIMANNFEMKNGQALSAKSTDGIVFKNNTIIKPSNDKMLTVFKDCTSVIESDNNVSIR